MALDDLTYDHEDLKNQVLIDNPEFEKYDDKILNKAIVYIVRMENHWENPKPVSGLNSKYLGYRKINKVLDEVRKDNTIPKIIKDFLIDVGKEELNEKDPNEILLKNNEYIDDDINILDDYYC